MAKFTRIPQRRLVATSIASILTAAIMMPTITDARGGSGGGHHGGGHAVSLLGFSHHHTSPSMGFPFAAARVPFSSRHDFSRHRVASRHSRTIGSDFFGLGAGGVWIDDASAPTIVVMQEPTIAQEPAPPRSPALVRTPGPEREGILVVRGTSKAYVTFPTDKRG